MMMVEVEKSLLYLIMLHKKKRELEEGVEGMNPYGEGK